MTDEENHASDSIIRIPESLSSSASYSSAGISTLSCTISNQSCSSLNQCGGCEITQCYVNTEGCTTAEYCTSCLTTQCGSCESSSQITPASFSITDITSNSATIYIVVGDSTSFRIYCRYEPDSGIAVVDTTVSGSSNFSYTITGLEPSTDYAINVKYNNGDAWCGALTFTTEEQSVEPWDWNIANSTSTSAANATAAQTQKAYAAVTGNGYITDFSYLVWNDIVCKAYEVLTSRGLSWNTDYATLSATKMTSSDRVMTALRFNSVWWNVGHMVTTGLSKVSTGDIIKGSYFVTLTNAINNSIQ